MSEDLIAFVRARLDERERVADMASEGAAEWRTWTQTDPEYEPGRIEDDGGGVVVYDEGRPTYAQAAHIAMHDPAWVLRDVEAKRKILALYDANGGQWIWALRALAALDADHPDYKQEWA